MSIRVASILSERIKNYLNPWEYPEVRIALDKAFAKYSIEEIAGAIDVTTNQLMKWKRKSSYPTRAKLKLLQNIDAYIKQ